MIRVKKKPKPQDQSGGEVAIGCLVMPLIILFALLVLVFWLLVGWWLFGLARLIHEFRLKEPKSVNLVLIDPVHFEQERHILRTIANSVVDEIDTGRREVARTFRYEKVFRSRVLQRMYRDLKSSYFITSEEGKARRLLILELLSTDLPEHRLIVTYLRLRKAYLSDRDEVIREVQSVTAEWAMGTEESK
ncbi:MAG: hypothetical protein WAU88_10865 [Candidatus Zixiibacteriota bacterium]